MEGKADRVKEWPQPPTKASRVMVEMPVSYLVQIATHGNMGTGKLSMFIKSWAERMCRKHGLHDMVVKELDKKIAQSRKNLENVLGKEIMGELDAHIDKGLEKVKKAWETKEDGDGKKTAQS